MPHIFGATNYFEEWLHPVMAGHNQEAASHALASAGADTSMEWTLMFASIALVFLSIFLAWYFYRKNLAATGNLAGKLSGVKKTLENKYYVDELYGAAVVRPLIYFSLFLWKIFDVVIIDGFLNGLASLWHDISNTLRYSESGRVRSYVAIFTLGVILVMAYFVLGSN
jgi:NADH-quinone oxidoreductase subunit L